MKYGKIKKNDMVKICSSEIRNHNDIAQDSDVNNVRRHNYYSEIINLLAHINARKTMYKNKLLTETEENWILLLDKAISDLDELSNTIINTMSSKIDELENKHSMLLRRYL